MRAFVPLALAAALLFAAPGTASADVIFDPVDADDLAATLTQATATQGVCYGWYVTVNDVSQTDDSIGSNFGAGQPVSSGSCDARVEFTATITYTAESSESEDSATYDVQSSPGGPTRADLDALGLDMDGLTGEDPDVVIGNAVTALPLLAADLGLGKPISAAPETGAAPADAQLTDDPGSDWWRTSGGMVLWALALIAAGALFAWWVVVINRRRVAAEQAAVERAEREAAEERRKRGRRGRPAPPRSVASSTPDPTPPTQPIPAQTTPEPPTSPLPTQSATTDEPSPTGQSAEGEPVAPPAAQSEEDTKPSAQKDKE